VTTLLIYGLILTAVHCNQWERDYDGGWHAAHADVVIGEPVFYEDGGMSIDEWPAHYDNVFVPFSNGLDDRCWRERNAGVR
jgi:hypothetical protein